jgi:hypothetical protein
VNRTEFAFCGGNRKNESILVCQVSVDCTKSQPRGVAQFLTRGQESNEVVSGRSGVNNDIGRVHADRVIEMIVFNMLDLLDDVIAFIRQLLFNRYRLRGLVGTRSENEYKCELGYDYSIHYLCSVHSLTIAE